MNAAINYFAICCNIYFMNIVNIVCFRLQYFIASSLASQTDEEGSRTPK
jgi:hypothetical protein